MKDSEEVAKKVIKTHQEKLLSPSNQQSPSSNKSSNRNILIGLLL